MAVEAATYLSDLNATLPAEGNPLAEGDNHLRLLKTVLLATFPAITGALTPSHTDLNAAGLAFHNAGTVVLPANGTSASAIGVLKAVSGSGDVSVINSGTSLGSGGAILRVNDATNANPHDVLTANYAGTVAALAALDAPVVRQGGYALVPSGGIIIWSGSLASLPGGWALCDGTNGTPDLRNFMVIGAGSTYAVGQTGGAVSAAVTSTPAGSHSHGGATGSGGSHSHGGSSGAYSLTQSDIPSHTHTATVIDPGHVHASKWGADYNSPNGDKNASATTSNYKGTDGVMVQSGTTGITVSLSSTGGGGAHSHTISTEPAHSHTISTEPDHTHSVTVPTLPPYVALGFIMKL